MMSRRRFILIRRVTLFLLLGAIINIAVAWACAIWSDRAALIENGVSVSFMPSAWVTEVLTPADRPLLAVADLTMNAASCKYRTAFGIDRRAFVPNATSDTSTASTQAAWMQQLSRLPKAVEIRAGWPFLALRARQWLDASKPPADPYAYDSPLIVIVGTGTIFPIPARRALPIRVLWPGFVANAVLFGGMASLLLGGTRFIRRSIRAGRKCCGECGYPIGVSPVCTECGSPIDYNHWPLVIKRRHLGRLICFLSVAALFSVISAWLCALYAPVINEAAEPRRAAPPVWWTDRDRADQPLRRIIGIGFTIDVFRTGHWGCNLIRAGWPMSVAEHSVEFWDSGATRVEEVHGGLLPPRWLGSDQWDRKYLSGRINWRGLIVDAFVWGGIFWCAALFISRIRKRRT